MTYISTKTFSLEHLQNNIISAKTFSLEHLENDIHFC